MTDEQNQSTFTFMSQKFEHFIVNIKSVTFPTGRLLMINFDVQTSPSNPSELIISDTGILTKHTS
jgi:hypothetical protein